MKRFAVTLVVILLVADIATNVGVLRQRAQVRADIAAMSAALAAMPENVANGVYKHLKDEDALRLPEPGSVMPTPTPDFRATPEIQPFYPDDPSDRRATPTPMPAGLST